MSEPAEPKVQSKPSQWPGEWVRDEGFWKDITTRTVSGLLIIAVGYGLAVASGFIAQPLVLRLTLTLLTAFASIGVTAWLIIRHQTKVHEREKASGIKEPIPDFTRSQRVWHGILFALWLVGNMLLPWLVLQLVP